VVIVVVKCVLKERESERGKFSAAIFKEQKTEKRWKIRKEKKLFFFDARACVSLSLSLHALLHSASSFFLSSLKEKERCSSRDGCVLLLGLSPS
jgi:hypothetical protein